MARLRVLVSAGTFGLGGADRPVCPPVCTRAALVPANKTRKWRNVPKAAFTVIAVSLDWNYTAASENTKTVSV